VVPVVEVEAIPATIKNENDEEEDGSIADDNDDNSADTLRPQTQTSLKKVKMKMMKS
jgi:hypothetical protein